MIAEKIAKVPHGGAIYKQSIDVTRGTSMSPPNTRAEAAALVGTTPTAISKARLINEWPSTEAKQVQNGKLTFEEGYQIACKTKMLALGKFTNRVEARQPRTLIATACSSSSALSRPAS